MSQHQPYEHMKPSVLTHGRLPFTRSQTMCGSANDDPSMIDTPRTEAGRRLLAKITGEQEPTDTVTRLVADAILAIEAEAAAGPRDLYPESMHVHAGMWCLPCVKYGEAAAGLRHVPEVVGHCDTGVFLGCSCGWRDGYGVTWEQHSKGERK